MLSAAFLALSVATAPFRPSNRIPLPPSSNEFDFVVLGDNRPAGSGMPPTAAFREILKEVALIKPAFVLSSGDLMYGNEESLAAYRKESGEITALIAGLHIPYFNVPGNHELADRAELQSEYQKRFGDLYGSFEYGGCRFVAIATDEVGHTEHLSDAQRGSLESALDGSEPTFVFMHRPVFAREGNTEAGATSPDAAELATLIRKARAKAVFEAHDHVYNRQEHDGIEYIISGAAGAPLDAPPQSGGFFHYLLVHVKDGKPTIEVLPVFSVQVTEEGDTTRIGNYSDYDLPLSGIRIHTKTAPSHVSGFVDVKGKLEPVPVQIEVVESESVGYAVQVKFTLAKHRETILKNGN